MELFSVSCAFSAIQQLEDVLGRCSQSRKSLEHVIRDLRLLFKPWPVEKPKEKPPREQPPSTTQEPGV